MVELTNIEERAPKAFKKARTERPWVSRLSVDTFRVIPRTLKDGSREHGKYIVTFALVDGDLFAECVELRTGEQCPAHRFGRVCYHIGAAIIHGDQLARREQIAA